MLYKFTLLLAMNEESNFPTSLLSPIICPVESCIPNVYEVVMICISLMVSVVGQLHMFFWEACI